MKVDAAQIYRKMLTCRRVEEALGKLWHDGIISGEMHLGIGEEGINVGVLDHVGDGDGIALDHRSTAGMVLKGVDITAIIKECIGLPDGLCHGMGGHMHLYSKAHLAGSSGIVGAAGPVACGFALSAQHLRKGKIAVAFFGESAMNIGHLMESMNLASAWNLPVLFVCRDNGMAITTPTELSTGGDIVERARGLGLKTLSLDGSDVRGVWQAAGKLISELRQGGQPAFLHLTCVRPEGHFLGDPFVRITRSPVAEMSKRLKDMLSGSAFSSPGASLTERVGGVAGVVTGLKRTLSSQSFSEKDPIRIYRKKSKLSKRQLKKIEVTVAQEVDQAVVVAMQAYQAYLPTIQQSHQRYANEVSL